MCSFTAAMSSRHLILAVLYYLLMLNAGANPKTNPLINSTPTEAYSGIGSRKAPRDILNLMEEVSYKLAHLGLTLRSGGAPGADSFFEKGCDNALGRKEIYLPWKDFNNNPSNLICPVNEAFKIAKSIHPRWANCSATSQKFHARNVHQVLGTNLDSPVRFVLFWAETKNQKVQGGTATAVNLAIQLNIPTFNLLENQIKKEWEIFLSPKIQSLQWLQNLQTAQINPKGTISKPHQLS